MFIERLRLKIRDPYIVSAPCICAYKKKRKLEDVIVVLSPFTRRSGHVLCTRMSPLERAGSSRAEQASAVRYASADRVLCNVCAVAFGLLQENLNSDAKHQVAHVQRSLSLKYPYPGKRCSDRLSILIPIVLVITKIHILLTHMHVICSSYIVIFFLVVVCYKNDYQTQKLAIGKGENVLDIYK